MNLFLFQLHFETGYCERFKYSLHLQTCKILPLLWIKN